MKPYRLFLGIIILTVVSGPIIAASPEAIEISVKNMVHKYYDGTLIKEKAYIALSNMYRVTRNRNIDMDYLKSSSYLFGVLASFKDIDAEHPGVLDKMISSKTTSEIDSISNELNGPDEDLYMSITNKVWQGNLKNVPKEEFINLILTSDNCTAKGYVNGKEIRQLSVSSKSGSALVFPINKKDPFLKKEKNSLKIVAKKTDTKKSASLFVAIKTLSKGDIADTSIAKKSPVIKMTDKELSSKEPARKTVNF